MQTKELLTLGAAYSKKSLSEIFEDPALKTLQEGIYTVKRFNSILLFVDLLKKGKEERFQFDDYFNEDHFEWDSQTTQHIKTPRIQSIVNKEREVHLFCRLQQKVKGFTQPFYYCGELEYLDYDETTSKPVHLEFLAIDYDPNTSNEHLLELYNWKPETNIKETTKTTKKGLPKRGYKKPNFTERRGLVISRVGQGYYRQEILEKWEYKCAVTGCDVRSILIASHIKGWGESNDDERLDPNNGILLSPNVDALFDKHLISFSDDGKIIVSKNISLEQLTLLGLSTDIYITVNENMIKYLKYHRGRFSVLEG